MKIRINDIESYRTPESCTITVDNRIEKIQLINGNTVQDYGHIESGDTFTISALFKRSDFDALMTLWNNRTPVTFKDESGHTYANCRLVIKSYKYETKFPSYVMLEFEIWRI